MLNLDPEFRALLLRHHRSLDDQKQRTHNLTYEILDKYERRIGQRIIMQRALARISPKIPVPKGFDPVKIGEALKFINSKIAKIQQNNMPDFYQVHTAWSARRRAFVLGSAKNTFNNSWKQPFENLHLWFPKIVWIIVSIVLLGSTATGILGTVNSKIIPPTVVDKLVSPDSQSKNNLNKAEKQILMGWYQGKMSGDKSYSSGFVNFNRSSLENIGKKLLIQGKEWLRRVPEGHIDSVDETKGKVRLSWACEIGTVLEQSCGDKALLDSVSVVLSRFHKSHQPLSTKKM